MFHQICCLSVGFHIADNWTLHFPSDIYVKKNHQKNRKNNIKYIFTLRLFNTAITMIYIVVSKMSRYSIIPFVVFLKLDKIFVCIFWHRRNTSKCNYTTQRLTTNWYKKRQTPWKIRKRPVLKGTLCMEQKITTTNAKHLPLYWAARILMY